MLIFSTEKIRRTKILSNLGQLENEVIAISCSLIKVEVSYVLITILFELIT